MDFLSSIKCQAVLNCAGGSVPNIFSKFGIRYLTYRWADCKGTVMFDPKVFKKKLQNRKEERTKNKIIKKKSNGTNKQQCLIFSGSSEKIEGEKINEAPQTKTKKRAKC